MTARSCSATSTMPCRIPRRAPRRSRPGCRHLCEERTRPPRDDRTLDPLEADARYRRGADWAVPEGQVRLDLAVPADRLPADRHPAPGSRQPDERQHLPQALRSLQRSLGTGDGQHHATTSGRRPAEPRRRATSTATSNISPTTPTAIPTRPIRSRSMAPTAGRSVSMPMPATRG